MEQRARCSGCHAINPEGRWVCYCCGEWLRQDETLASRPAADGWHLVQLERSTNAQEAANGTLKAAPEPG